MRALEEAEVGAAWMRAMDALASDSADLVARFRKEQEALWEAMAVDFEQLTEEAASVYLTLIVAVWQVFGYSWKGGQAAPPAVDEASVKRWQQRRCEALAAFLQARRRIGEGDLVERLERAASVQELRQPVVLGFAVECLLDVVQDENLDDAVAERIFVRLVLLIECLDRVCV